jgi:hypothetical protein
MLINSASGNCAIRINSNGPPQIHKGPDRQGHQGHREEGPLRDLGKQRRSRRAGGTAEAGELSLLLQVAQEGAHHQAGHEQGQEEAQITDQMLRA